MKTSYLLLGAVPLLCAAGGYAAGQQLKPGPVAVETASLAAPEDAAAPHAKGTDPKDPHDAAPDASDHRPAPGHDTAQVPQTDAAAVLDRLADAAPPRGTVAGGPAEPTHAPEQNPPHAEPDGEETAAPRVRKTAGTHTTPTADLDAHTAGPAVADARIVELGRMRVPVYKPKSVTYVVADFGVAVKDADVATHYNVAENATRLRDAILTSLHRAAETRVMKGPIIDSNSLANMLAADLKPAFSGVEDVLFLSLYQKDVPRS